MNGYKHIEIELDDFWKEYVASIQDPRWREVGERRIKCMLSAKWSYGSDPRQD